MYISGIHFTREERERAKYIFLKIYSHTLDFISIKKCAVLWLSAPLHRIYTTIRDRDIKTPRIPWLQSPMRDREEPCEAKGKRRIRCRFLSLSSCLLLVFSVSHSTGYGTRRLVKQATLRAEILNTRPKVRIIFFSLSFSRVN